VEEGVTMQHLVLLLLTHVLWHSPK
jgi:hypothetical protein